MGNYRNLSPKGVTNNTMITTITIAKTMQHHPHDDTHGFFPFVGVSPFGERFL